MTNQAVTEFAEVVSQALVEMNSLGAAFLYFTEQPVFIRPVGDTSESLWQNAQVRVDRNVERLVPGNYIACVVDPFGQHYGGLKPSDYHYVSVQSPCIFAARLFDLKDTFVPMVQVVDVSADGAVVTVETNVGVEFYQPVV